MDWSIRGCKGPAILGNAHTGLMDVRLYGEHLPPLPLPLCPPPPHVVRGGFRVEGSGLVRLVLSLALGFPSPPPWFVGPLRSLQASGMVPLALLWSLQAPWPQTQTV